MIGICAYGAYLPILRLSRDEIAKQWEGYSLRGERTVANCDEDTITMAVEAGRDCLKTGGKAGVNALFFASTTPPYREKQSAALVATAMDLERKILAADFTDSIRSATIALRQALDTVQGGGAEKVLVTSADIRPGTPQSEFETLFGDGAAAVLVGKENVIASLEGAYRHTDEFLDLWRLEDGQFTESWEDRFVKEYGHQRNVVTAGRAFFSEKGIGPAEITKAVIYSPDLRNHQTVAKLLGFDYQKQVQDLLFGNIGITGAAHSLLMLVAALEKAKAGDTILLLGYGDGADAFLFRVTENIEKARGSRGVSGWLARKLPISYM